MIIMYEDFNHRQSYKAWEPLDQFAQSGAGWGFFDPNSEMRDVIYRKDSCIPRYNVL